MTSSVSIAKSIQEIYFDAILLGTKTIEGRLNKDDWSQLKTGDQILLYTKNEHKYKQVSVKIIDICKYKDFEQMIVSEGLKKLLPGIQSLTDATNIYNQFYSIDDINKYGVLAIQIEALPETFNVTKILS